MRANKEPLTEKTNDRKNKLNNVITEVDGITFHSKKEAERYQELKLLERAGVISDLDLQKKFLLIPSQKLDTPRRTKKGKWQKTERPTTYKADFVYTVNKTGEQVVEDVKGMATEVYKIKRKLMKQVHNIEIFES